MLLAGDIDEHTADLRLALADVEHAGDLEDVDHASVLADHAVVGLV